MSKRLREALEEYRSCQGEGCWCSVYENIHDNIDEALSPSPDSKPTNQEPKATVEELKDRVIEAARQMNQMHWKECRCMICDSIISLNSALRGGKESKPDEF